MPSYFNAKFYLTTHKTVQLPIPWGAAIAQWIRLCLVSCHTGFEYQAHHLYFLRFIELCIVEKTKINKKEAGNETFKNTYSFSTPFQGTKEANSLSLACHCKILIWMISSSRPNPYSPTDEDSVLGKFTTTTGKSVELEKPSREVRLACF